MRKRPSRSPRRPRHYPLSFDTAAASRPPPIRAKITPPGALNVLERTRLYTLMEGERPVIWIASPAGSGKTSLAAGWAAAENIRCLWYQIDEGDASLPDFFRHMAGAARNTSPHRTIPLPVLPPEYAGSIGLFTKHYFERFYASLPSSSIIILDNYHLVPEDSSFHEVVATALEMLPEGIRAVVLSRSSPPPQFIRLRAHEKMQYLGWEDLRMTSEELEAFVRLRGIDIPDGDTLIRHIYKVTEGWAAGITLYMEHLKAGRGDGTEITRSAPREIFDYFSTEIYRNLGTELQQFLLKTSFLPEMTASAAGKLTEDKGAGRILSFMCSQNNFTICHSGSEPVYQYHPLFRNFLRARAMETLAPAELSPLLAKAGSLMEESGSVEEAAELYIIACSWDSLAKVIESAAPDLISSGRSGIVEGWIDRIPQDILESSPWLLYWKGLCRLSQDPSSSRVLFDRAFTAFEDRDDLPGLCAVWTRSIEAIIGEWRDFTPLDRRIAWFEKMLESHIEFPSDAVEADMAVCMVYALVHRQLWHPLIGEWVKKALSLTYNRKDMGLRTKAIVYASQYYTFIGDRVRMITALDDMKTLEQMHPDEPLLKIHCACMEAATHTWADIDREKLKWAVFRGLACAEMHGMHMWDFLFHLLGAFWSLNFGDMPDASSHLKKSAISAGMNHQSICHYNHVAAWYYLLEGDVARARLHAQNALQAMGELGASFADVICHHVMAQVAQREGSYQEADLHLARMGETAEKSGSAFFVYTYLVAEAQFSMERGDDERCLGFLRRAFQLGREHHLFSLFWWSNPRAMSLLCGKALEAGIEEEYVSSLIRIRRLKPDASLPAVVNWPWRVRIHTIGGFSLFRDGRKISLPKKGDQKPVAMLKALAGSGKSGTSREHLIDLLWPDKDGDKALQSFKFTLHQIRRLIGNDAVLQQGGMVMLNYEVCWSDLA